MTSAFNDPLPGILKEFREGWPEVELLAREIDTHDGQDALMRGEIDVAVIRQSVGDRHVTSIPLRQDRFVLAMPLGHKKASKDGPVKLANFRDESWVWLNRPISPDYHDELVAACQQAGFRPQPRHYGNSIHSQLAMVACGLGVTLVPASSVHLNVQSVIFKELTTRADLVELSLLYRSDMTEPLVKHFVKCAREHAGYKPVRLFVVELAANAPADSRQIGNHVGALEHLGEETGAVSDKAKPRNGLFVPRFHQICRFWVSTLQHERRSIFHSPVNDRAAARTGPLRCVLVVKLGHHHFEQKSQNRACTPDDVRAG